MMRPLLERAALSRLGLDSGTSLKAFSGAPIHRSGEPQLVCEAGENALRYFTALSGNGYMLIHRGSRKVESGEGPMEADSYDIVRAGSPDKPIGEAEAYSGADGTLRVFAFEIAATEIITVSMLARALR